MAIAPSFLTFCMFYIEAARLSPRPYGKQLDVFLDV